MNGIKIKSRKPIRVGAVIAFVFFLIYAISLIVPILWGLMISLQSWFQNMQNQNAFPSPPEFYNYVKAFLELEQNGTGLPVMIFNSLWYSLGSAIFHVFVSVSVGYVCANYRFRLNKVMYWLAIMTMMIPIMGSLPAQIRVSSQVGVYDSPLTLITAASALGDTFIISYAFFKGVSWNYAESAFIDGAGHFRVFFQIMLPLAWSPIIALILTDFIAGWGDATGPLIFLPSWPTLASGFYTYSSVKQRALGTTPVLFAGLFIAAIPIITLYLVFQKTLMDLQIGGGLKG